MIEKFAYYVDNNLVRTGSPDIQEALSLIRKSVNRIAYITGQKLNERNAEFIFEDVYEAVREASQSLMAIKGYKPYSHEALISVLLEFYSLPKEDISAFDRYRILRNKCVYAGAKVSVTVCDESINFLNRFLPKIKQIFEKESKIKV